MKINNVLIVTLLLSAGSAFAAELPAVFGTMNIEDSKKIIHQYVQHQQNREARELTYQGNAVLGTVSVIALLKTSLSSIDSLWNFYKSNYAAKSLTPFLWTVPTAWLAKGLLNHIKQTNKDLEEQAAMQDEAYLLDLVAEYQATQ